MSDAASSFVTKHKYLVAIVAAVSTAGLIGVLVSMNMQGKTVSKEEKKKADKKKKKKAKKAAKKAGSADADAENAGADGAVSEKDVPYPVKANGDPDVTAEAVASLNEDDKNKWATALKEKGNIYFKKKEYETAIKYYSDALLCKQDPVYYSNRSACYSALGDNDNTIADTSKALELKPDYAKCLLRRARAYENEEKYGDAMYDLTALSIYGGVSNVSTEAMLERILKKHTGKVYEEKYSKLPKTLPSASSLSSFFGAFTSEDIDMNPSDYKEGSGERYLVQALAEMSLDTEESYQTADQYLLKAVSVFDKSTEGADPKLVALAYEYAGAFAFLKTDSEGAAQDLDKALAASPRPRSYVISGLIKADQGDYTSAEAEFNNAIKLLPNDPDIYYHYGQIFYLIGDLDKAKKNFEKAKELNPNNLYAYIQLACLAYRQGETDKCDELFREAKQKFPTSPEVPNYYGEVLNDRQDLDGALKQFDTAARLQEAHPTFNVGALPLINKAGVYQRREDMPMTVKLLEQACKLDPKSEVARLNLGQVYLRQAMVDEASAEFDKACQLARSPDDRAQAISLMEASKMQQKIKDDPLLSKKVQELMASMPQPM